MILSRSPIRSDRLIADHRYSIRQICKDLNVSHHTVHRFILSGWLLMQGGRITEESYRRLCRVHENEFNWESLTDAEVERVFRAVDRFELGVRKRNRALICLLVEAGLRASENHGAAGRRCTVAQRRSRPHFWRKVGTSS